MRNQKKEETVVGKATRKAPKTSTETRLRKDLKYLREANTELIRQFWLARVEHESYVQKTDQIIWLLENINQLTKEISVGMDMIIARIAAGNPDDLLSITDDGIALKLPSSKLEL